jgi:multicomponent Na+:H+ antiporter subunit A
VPAVSAGEVRVVSHPWVEQLGLSLAWRLDGLSLLFSLLITGIGALVALHAGSYLKGNEQLGRFYAFFFMFMASMLGVVLADNVLLLFVFWELTSLSSYFLIGFEHERAAARAAAWQALLVTGTGGLALLFGAVLLAQASGSYELSQILRVTDDVRQHAYYPAIVVAMLAAAFTKSAQFPFHFWLPSAMEAPTPVSAYLHAATMVKAGVYLVARLGPILAGSVLWHESLISVGVVTAVLGAGFALGERHIKRVLAYSTVSALGLMVLMVGIGSIASLRALMVLLAAHGLYKGALFLVAGALTHATHETDVERLGRLRSAMPATALAAGLAALSMGGLPPLLGFLQKELVYEATLHAGPAAALHDGAAAALHDGPAVLLTASALAVNACFLAVAINVGLRPFWAGVSVAKRPEREADWPLWSAPLVLAASGLLFGTWPAAIDGLLQAATRASAPRASLAPLALWHGVTVPLGLSALTLALGYVLYRARGWLRGELRPLAWLTRLGPAHGYELALAGLNALARLQTRWLQRGYLRGYLGIIVTTALVLVGFTLVGRHGLPALASHRDFRFYEVLTAALILVATFSAIRSNSRLASIVSLGVVGYGVAVIFVLFGAPDVGITQLVVETLTVILLVLAFYHLPRFATLSSPRDRARDGIIATGFGALMTTLVLVAATIPTPKTVARYLGQVSLARAHGRNIVNVILTDVRALDTLGEITVLATAAFGVVALLRLWPRGGKT